MVFCILLAVAAILDPAAWKCPPGVSVRADGGSLVFSIDAKSKDPVFATADLPLPAADAEGRLTQDVEVENVARLVWGGDLSVAQMDASGKRLAESLVDIRETSHMRPVGRKVRYRDEGRLHPSAKSLQARVELRRPTKDYGAGDLLRLTRLSFSAADPKPPLNGAFFSGGVSGSKGDRSLVLGGAHGIALAYQTRSRGAWSDMVQFRREEDVFYPAGAGTVEAFFRPDASRLGREATLFEAYNGYVCGRYHVKGFGAGLGSVMRLAYLPSARKMSLSMRDWRGKAFGCEFENVELHDGTWTHVAVQWTPDGKAELFVGGTKRGEMSLAGYQALPLGDESVSDINDRHATEFFLGASAEDTRLRHADRKPQTMFQGAVDELRVSTGCRYRGAFTPASGFAVDASTRALFTFDRDFDGVSGGGLGWMPASVYANVGRCDYQGRMPSEIVPENDPRRVFEIVNYRDVPSENEFREARRRVVKSRRIKTGGAFAVDVPQRFYMDYVEISNERGARPLAGVRLVNKGRADPASFEDMRGSMGLDGLPDREKANRLFQYAISASDYFMNNQVDFAAGGDEPHSVIMDGLAMLNGYCGFECGPLNTVAANLFTLVGDLPASVALGYGHMFEQVYFDGKNHIYDLSAQKFFPCFDNTTSASLAEMGDEPGVFWRMGACPDHYIRKGTCDRESRNPVYFDRMAVTLNPGERFRAYAANDGQMNNLQVMRRGSAGNRIKNSAGDDERDYGKLVNADDSKMLVFRRDRIFPHFSNAFVTFDGRPAVDNPAFSDGGGSFTYSVRNPFPIVFGEYAAFLKRGGTAKLELSTDRGRTFRALPQGADGVSRLEYLVKARHEYLIKVCAPMSDVGRFAARTEVMFNPRIFAGWLHSGRNELTLKGDGGEAEVSVAWREPAKEISIGDNSACSGTIPGLERQIVLADPYSPLRLKVSGAGADAKVRTSGKVKAAIAGGELTVSYDPSAPRLIRRGDDNPEPHAEFPQIAVVEVVDGDAVKPLTVVVSPNARLIRLDRPAMCRKSGEKVTFPCVGLKPGNYAVFSLSRFPGEMERYGGAFRLKDPAKPSDAPTIAKYHNGAFDYLKAGYSRKGERARWKWDTAVPLGKGLPREHGAWSFRTFEAPEKAFEVVLAGDVPEGAEIAALMVLPFPDMEARLDLRKILFGINCQPQMLRDAFLPETPQKANVPLTAEAESRPPSARIAAIRPVKNGELRLAPTFTCCSVSFGAPETEGLVMEYRKAGGSSAATWTEFRLPCHFKETQEYRGSIWGLNENSSYEVRFRLGDHELAKGAFTTWTTRVPIARTVELDPATVKFPVVVSDRGTPNGWICYTAKSGTVLHNPGKGDHFTVTNAAYVVFDAMELTGGEHGHVFNLVQSQDIRCRNLNIHDWGQTGVSSYTEKDLGRVVRAPGFWAVNDHAFFVGRGMKNTVIERCWVHDQHSRSVSWYYSHPYGQNAVTMAQPDGNTVLRWNDFIGSDDHRWNDAVTSYGNFDPDGGFNRDADVYGNYMCFAGDDGIELDGGQQNIRVWENRFDMSYTGVSVQGNTVSPSYVWRNWFGPCRDEFGLRGATIKTSGVMKGSAGESVSLIWGNTLGGGGWGEPIWLHEGYRLVAWDNKTLNSQKAYAWRSDADRAAATLLPDTDCVGAVRPGETESLWPVRPLPFVLDRQTIDVGRSREKVRFKAWWIGGKSSKPVGFKVVKNSAFGWFDVAPKEGVIGPEGLDFTLSFNGREPDRRFLGGVFLVRTKHGLSRPCLVTAETDYVHPLVCHRPGEFAEYATGLKPDAGGWYEASFDVPKGGTYYFMVRGTGHAPVYDGRRRPELEVSVDGAKSEVSVQQTDLFPTWTMICPSRKFGRMIRQYDLDAGRHVLRFRLIKNGFDIEAAAITDSPGSFERR